MDGKPSSGRCSAVVTVAIWRHGAKPFFVAKAFGAKRSPFGPLEASVRMESAKSAYGSRGAGFQTLLISVHSLFGGSLLKKLSNQNMLLRLLSNSGSGVGFRIRILMGTSVKPLRTLNPYGPK